jgi:hypothetical protein
MSWREALSIIVRARREGVTLFTKADGKLGWKAAQRPSDALLAVLKEHREEILAALPPPSAPPPPCASIAVERAKRTIWQLRSLGFRPRLDAEGALGIVDTYATGKKRRDVSQRLPIAEVFDTLVAGLNEDPGLLDSYGPPHERSK